MMVNWETQATKATIGKCECNVHTDEWTDGKYNFVAKHENGDTITGVRDSLTDAMAAAYNAAEFLNSRYTK